MRLLKVAVITLALSISIPIAQACACSCIYRTESEHMEAADAVFEGVVIERRDPPDSAQTGSGDQIEWTFDVEETFKGDVRDPQSIWSAREASTCGFRFEVGKRYRVFAYNFEERMQTSNCSGTRSAGETVPIESPSPSPVPEQSPTPQPANSPPVAEAIALPVASQSPASPGPIAVPPVEVSIPTIEPLALSVSRSSTPAKLPTAGIAMSIGILAAGAATARRWRRAKRN